MIRYLKANWPEYVCGIILAASLCPLWLYAPTKAPRRVKACEGISTGICHCDESGVCLCEPGGRCCDACRDLRTPAEMEAEKQAKLLEQAERFKRKGDK